MNKVKSRERTKITQTARQQAGAGSGHLTPSPSCSHNTHRVGSASWAILDSGNWVRSRSCMGSIPYCFRVQYRQQILLTWTMFFISPWFSAIFMYHKTYRSNVLCLLTCILWVSVILQQVILLSLSSVTPPIEELDLSAHCHVICSISL